MKRLLAILIPAALLLTACSAGEDASSDQESASMQESAASVSSSSASESSGEPDLSEPEEPQDAEEEPQTPSEAAPGGGTAPSAVEVELPEGGASALSPQSPQSGTTAATVLDVTGPLAPGEYRIVAEHITLAAGDAMYLEMTASGSGRLEWGFLDAAELPDNASTRYYMSQRDIDGEAVPLETLSGSPQVVQDFPMPDSCLFYVYNIGDGVLELAGTVRIEAL